MFQINDWLLLTVHQLAGAYYAGIVLGNIGHPFGHYSYHRVGILQVLREGGG